MHIIFDVVSVQTFQIQYVFNQKLNFLSFHCAGNPRYLFFLKWYNFIFGYNLHAISTIICTHKPVLVLQLTVCINNLWFFTSARKSIATYFACFDTAFTARKASLPYLRCTFVTIISWWWHEIKSISKLFKILNYVENYIHNLR